MRLSLKATPAIALALLTVAIVGCKAAPSLVGTWGASLNGQNLEFNFKSDGSSLMTGTAGPLKLKVTGTYKIDGDKFDLTTTKVEIPGAPAQVLAAVKSKEGQTQTGKIVFTSNDDVQLTMDNQNIVLKRKN